MELTNYGYGNNDHYNSRGFQRSLTVESEGFKKQKIVNRAEERRDSSWFQYWRTCWSVYGAGIFCIPYKVSFNTSTQEFSVQSASYQKYIWIAMQMTGILVMRVRILEGWDYVKNSDEQLRYFDFGFLIVVYCFDATFKLILWGKRKKLEEFLEELQNSPLLSFSSKRSFKKLIFCHCLCVSYLIPSFFYFCLTWGIDSVDGSKFYEAVKSQAMATFNLQDDSWENSTYSPVILTCSFVINQYQASFWHFNDIYVLSSVFMMNNIAKDFNTALKTDSLMDSQGLALITAYQTLIRKFNDAMGLAVCVYSLYCSPYYAIHIVDMLSLPDFMNRFSMSVYLGFLAFGLASSVETNNKAWEIKKWLNWNQKNRKIKVQGLTLLLHELSEKNFGLGTFFKISNTLTGQVVNLILTLAIITIQMRMVSAAPAITEN